MGIRKANSSSFGQLQPLLISDFVVEFVFKTSCTWQWAVVKIHRWVFQWILDANEPSDRWSRWEESHLPRTRIARFTIVLSWVSRKKRCECRMIRRTRSWHCFTTWTGYGNLTINVQGCEKHGKANVGVDCFIWKSLSPYCIRHFQSTVNSRISASIVFNRIFSHWSTRGGPVLLSTWTDCSCLFMLIKEHVSITWIRYQWHTIYKVHSFQRLYAKFQKGKNQNGTLLCWISYLALFIRHRLGVGLDADGRGTSILS